MEQFLLVKSHKSLLDWEGRQRWGCWHHKMSLFPWAFLYTSIWAQDARVGWWNRKSLDSRWLWFWAPALLQDPGQVISPFWALVSSSVKNIIGVLLVRDLAAHNKKIDIYFSVMWKFRSRAVMSLPSIRHQNFFYLVAPGTWPSLLPSPHDPRWLLPSCLH